MSEKVKHFLLDFKFAATTSRGIDLVPRIGNMETLRYLGITKNNLEEILLGLSVADYCKGPIPDKDKPGELWEFGKDMDGEEVYIKLKVVKALNLAKCISFHIAKYPMQYPLKPNAQE
ncbi:MAG: toxin [Proteobacteria bacterium]|nr:toxin [Pseudomonadota bacterium]